MTFGLNVSLTSGHWRGLCGVVIESLHLSSPCGHFDCISFSSFLLLDCCLRLLPKFSWRNLISRCTSCDPSLETSLFFEVTMIQKLTFSTIIKNLFFLGGQYFILLPVLFLFFLKTVYLCSSGYPEAHCLDQADLDLRDSPASECWN